MLFNRLCVLSKLYVPDLLPMIKTSKFFIFPESKKRPFNGEKTTLTDGFFLPFQSVAFNRGNELHIITDTTDDQTGIITQRWFTVLTSFDLTRKHLIKSNQDHKIQWRMPKNSYFLAMGSVSDMKQEPDTEEKGKHTWSFKSNVRTMIINMSKGILKDTPYEKDDHLRNMHTLNAIDAMEQIELTNRPKRFIFEETRLKKIRKKKRTFIVKDPPIYTILKPNEIKKIIREKSLSKTDIKKMPHARRRHIRYMSDPIFSQKGKIPPKIITSGNRKGQIYFKKTIVPATWVGSTEKKIGNRIYKVLLDR